MTVDERLAALAASYGLAERAAEQLAQLLEMVERSPISLTAVREPARAVDVHIADSLLGLLVPDLRAADRLADLGSGAGFPGLVLAVALPGTSVTLVESVGKKAAFLLDARKLLELANVEVVAARAEEWTAGNETQAAVTARALAPLTTLIEYAAPLLRPGGILVAWKGPGAGHEQADGAAAAAMLGMTAPQDVAQPSSRTTLAHAERNTRLYVSSKVSTTPPGYPRRPGMARKRPIEAST